MSVSGTINGTTESASYTYDNLGRLATSSQTSNGTSAPQRTPAEPPPDSPKEPAKEV